MVSFLPAVLAGCDRYSCGGGPEYPTTFSRVYHGSGMDRNFARESEAYSIYGQLTWNFSDRFRAIVDLRYTEGDQDAVGASWPLTFPTASSFAPVRVLQSTVGANRRL